MESGVKNPKQAVYKAADVCAMAKVQSYVLRSWEAEFPNLGVEQPNGKTRLYRQSDLDTVLQIKKLIVVDGLTLGAARRKILKESPAGDSDDGDTLSFEALLGSEVGARMEEVKAGLRSILALLDKSDNGTASGDHNPDPVGHDPEPAAPAAARKTARRARSRKHT